MIDKYQLDDLRLRSDEKGELARWVIQLQSDLDDERRKSSANQALLAKLEAAEKERDESRRLVLIEASSFGNERFRADKLAKQVECQKDEIVKLTAKLKAAEARLLVPDDWNVLGPTYPAHYTPVLVAMNGVAQHITYQIEEGDNGDYWQPVGNEDADGAPITQFQHWKPLPTGFKVEGE